MKKKKQFINVFSKMIAVLLAVVFIVSFGMIHLMGTIPLKYFIPAFLVVLLMIRFLFSFLFDKEIKKSIKIILNIIAIFFIAGFVYIIVFVNNTVSFLDLIGINKNIEIYYLISLNDSEYDSLESVKDTNITVFDSGKSTVDLAIDKLKKEVSFNENKNDDLFDLVYNLYNDGLSSILVESSFMDLMIDEYDSFKETTRVIYEMKFEVKDDVTFTKVNPTKESFNIYISGIDSYGSLSTVSRSDVNMVATFNPITKEVLLTNIPRDYYVPLRDKPGLNDKLTHAGFYGINTSIGTVEDLLDIDINYYIKLNFTSVIDIVDDLDGIVVDSKYSFTAQTGERFTKGINKLNGKQALAFVRERYQLPGGDRGRGENQQEVIKAIMNKAINPAIIVNYNTILKSISNSFETNMKSNEVLSLVRMQLDDGKNWNIRSFSLNGTDASEYTYSYGREKLYVMKPDLDVVNEAIILINDVMN